MSTNKQKFNKKFGFEKDTAHSRAEISKLTGIPIGIINDAYKRGVGAHKTNIESVRVAATGKKDPKAPPSTKMSAEQWGQSRVYGLVMENPKQIKEGQPDADLWRRVLKHRARKNKK
jgi:hypothetical protein